MSYLNFLQRTSSGSASSNSTVSGETNDISIKWRGQLRNMIDFLTSGQSASLVFVHNAGTRKALINISRGATTYDIEGRVEDSVIISGRTITELSTDTDYIVYFAESTTSQGGVYAFLGIYDTAGTLIASATRGYASTFQTGGEIAINYQTGQDRTTGKVDGVVVYTGASAWKTGADRYNVPTAGDAGLASGWLFTETSGTSAANLLGGAESLSITGVENTDFAWASGGGWPSASSPTITGRGLLLGVG